MSEAALRNRFTNPKTKRAKRALKDRAPKVIEDAKRQILLRGTKSSPIINDVLRDLVLLHYPILCTPQRSNIVSFN